MSGSEAQAVEQIVDLLLIGYHVVATGVIHHRTVEQ